MKKIMILKLWLALLLAAGAAGNVLVAAEPAGPGLERKSAAADYLGKVVVVDRTAKAVTVAISGQMYLFHVSAATRLTQGEQSLPLADLLPGQFVRLSIRESASGTVELVSVEVVPGPEASEEAGKGKKGGISKASNRPGSRPPPVLLPAHVRLPPHVTLPPQVSPYR